MFEKITKWGRSGYFLKKLINHSNLVSNFPDFSVSMKFQVCLKEKFIVIKKLCKENFTIEHKSNLFNFQNRMILLLNSI